MYILKEYVSISFILYLNYIENFFDFVLGNKMKREKFNYRVILILKYFFIFSLNFVCVRKIFFKVKLWRLLYGFSFILCFLDRIFYFELFIMVFLVLR